nr:hypothetical protein [Acidobacteriota bacterium]
MPPTSEKDPQPYVGPIPFPSGQPLYGRDREVEDLLDLLIAERVVLLYSPSGAGKTSLIQAALGPRLKSENFEVMPIMLARRSPPPQEVLPTGVNRYVLSFLLSLDQGLYGKPTRTPLTELAGMTLDGYLEKLAAQPENSGDTPPRPPNMVLLFDQFEDVLALDPTDRAAKEELFIQLGTALRSRERWALFSMREEYRAGLDPYLRRIPTRFAATFRLEPLGRTAALAAIRKPACAFGVEFTGAAASQLVDDLSRVKILHNGTVQERSGHYVEPVQLQVVCLRLWEKLKPLKGSEIVKDDLRSVGDVDEALAAYYGDKIRAAAETQDREKLPAQHSQARERTLREWFGGRLITEHGFRAQVAKDLEPRDGLDTATLESLVDAHLVRKEELRSMTWYELTHDRLVDPVRRSNKAWFAENLKPFQRKAARWEEKGHPSGLLLRDEELEEARVWANAHAWELTETEKSFLSASREEQRAARRLRGLAQALAGVTLLLAILAAVLFQASQVASSQKQALEALDLVADHDKGALDHARQAAKTYRTVQAERALHAALRASLPTRQVPISSDWAGAVAFRPDGAVLAFVPPGALSPEVHFMDVGSGRSWPFVTDNRPVTSLAFSPPGRLLATGNLEGGVKLWNLDTRTPLILDLEKAEGPCAVSRSEASPLSRMAFSTDGKYLALADGLPYPTVWTADGGFVKCLPSESPVAALAWSDDSRYLATGGSNGKVVLWDISERGRSVELGGERGAHLEAVNGLAFSQGRLATASSDMTAKIWRLPTGKLEQSSKPEAIFGHDQAVWDVAFSPDGKYLVSGSSDLRRRSVARVWDLRSGLELYEVSPGRGAVVRVLFNPTGVLTTASTENVSGQREKQGEVTFWSAPFRDAIQHSAMSISLSPDETVQDLAFRAADSKLLIALSSNAGDAICDIARPGCTRRSWCTAKEKELIATKVFSADGRYLACGGVAGAFEVWDTLSAKRILSKDLRQLDPIACLLGCKVSAIGFSQDGNLVAVAGAPGSVSIWEMQSGRNLARRRRDGAPITTLA